MMIDSLSNAESVSSLPSFSPFHQPKKPRDDQTQNKKQKIQSVLVPLNDPSLIDDPVPLEHDLGECSSSTLNNDNQNKTKSISVTKTQQLTLPDMISNIKSIKGGIQESKRTNSIVYYFCKKIRMLKTLCPLYNLPNHDTIARSIKETFTVTSTKVQETISKVTYVAVTTDAWTEKMSMKSYLGITIHFINSAQLELVTIGTVQLFEVHTSNDSAANIKKTVIDNFGSDRQISCLAHMVNLVVEKRLTKHRKLILLHISRPVNKFLIDFYMLERFLRLANNISHVLMNFPEDDAPDMITATDLRNLKDICSLLGPMEVLTKELSVEKSVIKQKPEILMAKKLKLKLLEELNYRCSDPRFKDLHLRDPLINAKTQTLILNMMELEDSDDPRYICSNITTNDEEKNSSKVKYDLWGLHRNLCSTNNDKKKWLILLQEINFYKIAMKYLLIPATSVSTERLFNKAGATVTKSRNRLSGGTLTKLFLQ
ncbi:hypothetical protein QTP88_028340 [Uroleucon formosanum]